MTGRVTITRGTFPDHFDVDVDVPCVVRPAAAQGQLETVSGGEQVALHMYDVRLPYQQDIVRGDVLTVTRSADDLAVGRWLTVVQVITDDEQTTRIVIAKESR